MLLTPLLRQGETEEEIVVDPIQPTSGSVVNASSNIFNATNQQHLSSQSGGAISVGVPVRPTVEELMRRFYESGMPDDDRAQLKREIRSAILEQPNAFTELKISNDKEASFRLIPEYAYLEKLKNDPGTGSYYSIDNCSEYDSAEVVRIGSIKRERFDYWGQLTLPKMEALKSEGAEMGRQLKGLRGIIDQGKKRIIEFFSLRSKKSDQNRVAEGKGEDVKIDTKKVEPFGFDKTEAARLNTENASPNGIGIMTFDNNDNNVQLIGCFNQRGLLQGQGIARVPGVGTYFGDFRNGTPNGTGQFFHQNGDHFSGRYEVGMSSGPGVFTRTDGLRATSKRTTHGLFYKTKIEYLQTSKEGGGSDITEEERPTLSEERLDGTRTLPGNELPKGFVLADGVQRSGLYYRTVHGGFALAQSTDYQCHNYEVTYIIQPDGRAIKDYNHHRFSLNGNPDNIGRGDACDQKKGKGKVKA